jgi:tetratricopeptide (TPR) repeat protein
MKSRSLVLLAAIVLLGGRALSQQDPFGGHPVVTQSNLDANAGALTVAVLGKKNTRLDRQAVVKLYNEKDKSSRWQTTNSDGDAAFGDVALGRYDIEVSAVGYLTEHHEVTIMSTAVSSHVEFLLQPDSAAFDLNKMSKTSIPAKPRKEIQRGVIALKSGDYKRARKHLESALRDAPSSADANLLLGYIYFQDKQFDSAQNYLDVATRLDPRNVQAFTLLGEVCLQAKKYDSARATLEQAVTLDGDYWVAHNALAEVYLRQGAFEKARDHAEFGIEKSKGGGASGYLILGQALANLGQKQQALQALQSYVQKSPNSPGLPQVKDYIDQVEKRSSNPVAIGRAPTLVATVANETFQETDDLRLSLKSWHPPGIDELKPTLASGVACPSEEVIDHVGQRVEDLVNDVARFSAIEQVMHENLDELGHANTRETRQFNYFVEISQSDPGFVTEYRTAHKGLLDFPEQIATRGLPTLALVFHPAMRGNFQMTCEGLGEWQGRATWLVYFRQREDRPNRIRLYKIGDAVYPVNLKGRAWISSDKYQIVRIESELVSPLRPITLLSEYLSVDYGPVQFPRRNTELWLPKGADLYVDFRRRRFHRSHNFDNFMLFSVESQEKRKEPTAPTLAPTEPQQQ